MGQGLDFGRAERERSVEVLTRPSLSYWQDAMIRLRKNGRAVASLYIVLALIFFTVVGPFIWNVDPAYQDLAHISQSPSFGDQAVVVEEGREWEGLVREDFPEEPQEEVEELAAPSSIKIVGAPHIFSTRIEWEPVVGATGYAIFRNEAQPEDIFSLGVPLGDVEGGNRVGYEDRLKLEARSYYYSVVAKGFGGESEHFATLKVEVAQAIALEDAQKIRGDVKVGDQIRRAAHPLGTDYLGRDILARLMEGARVSLFIGLVTPFLYILIGTLYGGLSGYLGGRVDHWMMRAADFVVALPFLLFMIIFKVAFGIGPGESGILPMIVAFVALSWPAPARLVRGEILKLREEGFIQAAKLLGARPIYLLGRHMVPNMMGILIVTLTFAVPTAIFTEAFLSFIGMGVTPPTASWGTMCNEGIKTMLNTPHELLFPALIISFTVLAFNLLGDGLRDAMDARMRSRE